MDHGFSKRVLSNDIRKKYFFVCLKGAIFGNANFKNKGSKMLVTISTLIYTLLYVGIIYLRMNNNNLDKYKLGIRPVG